MFETISDLILPCPFCGHMPKVNKNRVQVTGCQFNYMIVCSDYCKEDKAFIANGGTKQEALEEWFLHCDEYSESELEDCKPEPKG